MAKSEIAVREELEFTPRIDDALPGLQDKRVVGRNAEKLMEARGGEPFHAGDKIAHMLVRANWREGAWNAQHHASLSPEDFVSARGCDDAVIQITQAHRGNAGAIDDGCKH